MFYDSRYHYHDRDDRNGRDCRVKCLLFFTFSDVNGLQYHHDYWKL